MGDMVPHRDNRRMRLIAKQIPWKEIVNGIITQDAPTCLRIQPKPRCQLIMVRTESNAIQIRKTQASKGQTLEKS